MGETARMFLSVGPLVLEVEYVAGDPCPATTGEHIVIDASWPYRVYNPVTGVPGPWSDGRDAVVATTTTSGAPHVDVEVNDA